MDRADDRRVASGKRRHGVIEVGNAAEAFRPGALHVCLARHGVRGIDADAHLADAAHCARRYTLRRERDDAVLQGVRVRGKAGEVAFVRCTQVGGVVRTFFFRT